MVSGVVVAGEAAAACEPSDSALSLVNGVCGASLACAKNDGSVPGESAVGTVRGFFALVLADAGEAAADAGRLADAGEETARLGGIDRRPRRWKER